MMIKKLSLVALAIVLCFGALSAQNGLDSVIVETFYIADANDATADEPLIEGAVTYRVYIDMAEGWEFQALYAEDSPASGKVDVLRIESTEPFFNNEDRGETFGYDIGTNRLDDGTVMVDSYLTTGRSSGDTEGVLKPDDTDGAIENGDGFLQNDDPLAGIPISQQDGNIESTSTISFSPTPGFADDLADVFGEDDQAGNSLVATNAALGLTESLVGPTEENRVLLGQFTTHGDFSFELNIQIRNIASGAVQQWVAKTPQADQFSMPSLIFPVNEAPVASIEADPTMGNVPLDVSFDASASTDDGEIVSYDWDFGDGTTGTGEMIDHTYTAIGTYTATVTVTDDGGATATASIDIVVEEVPNMNPVASFFASPNMGIAPLMVDFDASASSDADGEIVSYDWDFGNGMMGTGVNASTTYTDAGTYTVTLTVTDDDGATTTVTGTITVSEELNIAPTASISADPESGEAPLLVSFDASASTDTDGTITNYEWDFGDGTTGTGETVEHTFNTGTYTVVLTVTDDDGATGTAEVTIMVSDPPPNMAPTANFSAAPTTGSAPLLVNFNASTSSDSDGTISSYDWDFGDGTTGSGVTATHTFTVAGSYTVTLTVTDNDGATDMTTQTITLGQSDQEGLEGIIVETFYIADANDASAPEAVVEGAVTYRVYVDMAEDWEFQALYAEDNPAQNKVDVLKIESTEPFFNNEDRGATFGYDIGTNRLEEGTVMLDSYLTTGRTSEETAGVLKTEDTDGAIENADGFLQNDDPLAGIPISEQDGSHPSSSMLTFTPTPGFETILSAIFGEEDQAGSSLVVDNAALGMTESLQGPGSDNKLLIGQFTTHGQFCFELNVQLRNTITGEVQQWVAQTPATDQFSMESLVFCSNLGPVAAFTATPENGIAPLDVSFDASASSDSDGEIVSYVWDFGNGTTGTGVNASATYTEPGTYTVTLTVTDDDGATATATTTITVEEPSNNDPIAAFTATPENGTAPLDVDFDASASSDSDGEIVSYSWDFGNGTTGTGVNPSTTYSMPGTYTVTLTVTDDDGATATATTTITVEEAPNMNPIAVFTASPETGIAPLDVDFDASASSDPDGEIVSYSWDFGNGMTGTGVNASTTYTEPGTYTVTLTVTDDDGATASVSQTIEVEESIGVGTARVQFIHAAPFETVRIEINGVDYGEIYYLTADPYVDVPAGTLINIELIPTNFWTMASPVSFSLTLVPDETYVVTVHGTFDESDNIPVEAAIFAGSMESVGSSEVGLTFVHASPDQQEVDILTGGNVLYDDVAYGTYNDNYTTVPADSYILDVTPSNNNNNVLRRYALDIDWWKGRTAVVFATGFEADGSFRPWVALSTGGTFPLNELPTAANANLKGEIQSNVKASQNNLSVFPNPTTDWAQAQVSVLTEGNMQLGLYSSTGQHLTNIFEGVRTEGTYRFDLAVKHLPSGVYFVRMLTAEGTIVKPLVIKK